MGTMMDAVATADTVVIGAGAIGLGTAWRLAKAGRNVVVLEKGEVGCGASKDAAGMLAPMAEVDFCEREFLALRRESLRLYPEFVRELESASGVEVDHIHSGTLNIAIDRDDAEHLRHVYDYQQELGLPVTWLSGDEARELEPSLSPRIQAAVDVPAEGQIDTWKLMDALKAALPIGNSNPLREL